jgi:hypothetical protein
MFFILNDFVHLLNYFLPCVKTGTLLAILKQFFASRVFIIYFYEKELKMENVKSLNLCGCCLENNCGNCPNLREGGQR